MEIEKVIRILILSIAALCLLLAAAQALLFGCRPLHGTLPVWIIVIFLLYGGSKCKGKSGRRTVE